MLPKFSLTVKVKKSFPCPNRPLCQFISKPFLLLYSIPNLCFLAIPMWGDVLPCMPLHQAFIPRCVACSCSWHLPNTPLSFHTSHLFNDSPKHPSSFFKRLILFLFVVCVHVCVCVRTRVYKQMPRRSEEGMRFPGAGVTDGCEQFDVGVGNLT